MWFEVAIGDQRFCTNAGTIDDEREFSIDVLKLCEANIAPDPTIGVSETLREVIEIESSCRS